MIRQIRKYGNRKMYDLEGHRYVTLPEVFKMHKEGTQIIVTGPMEEDLTEVILAQAVFQAKIEDKDFRQMIINNAK